MRITVTTVDIDKRSLRFRAHAQLLTYAGYVRKAVTATVSTRRPLRYVKIPTKTRCPSPLQGATKKQARHMAAAFIIEWLLETVPEILFLKKNVHVLREIRHGMFHVLSVSAF